MAGLFSESRPSQKAFNLEKASKSVEDVQPGDTGSLPTSYYSTVKKDEN